MSDRRQSFGIEELDRSLGGGLLPGTLTVVAGATGAGKTQLGLRWADAGLAGRRSPRRALRLDQPRRFPESRAVCLAAVRLVARATIPSHSRLISDRAWDFTQPLGDYFHPVDRAGRRVTRADLDEEQWHEWKSDLSRVFRVRHRLFLSALRPRVAPRRLRRARAGRAIQ